MPILGTAGTLAALFHPTHSLHHVNVVIVTPLPITHVIPHATLPRSHAYVPGQMCRSSWKASVGQGVTETT